MAGTAREEAHPENPAPPEERLRELLRRPGSPRSLDDAELAELPLLYRRACSLLARSSGPEGDPERAEQARRLVAEAHRLLFGSRDLEPRGLVRRALDLFLVACPRAVREEWRLLALTFSLLYGLALLAWLAVRADLDLAYSLLDAGIVADQIEQLEATPAGEPFRGNFTFGPGRAPLTAGWILVHNMGVGLLFFASALVPPFYLFLLAKNALMLGSYTAVAGHWGQAGSISSILWCHGVLEIQAIVLAGTAGLVLVRALWKPGPWTRRHALERSARRALTLLAPVFPLLFVAGCIEGFVSPHAPAAIRLAVAVLSGMFLLAWVLLGTTGRRAGLIPRPSIPGPG